MDKPLHFQQRELSRKAVLIRCLDENREPIPNTTGTGFIRDEEDGLFLYTCWHLVTGLNPHNLEVPHRPPDRRYLEILLQKAQTRQPGVTAIGGLQTHIVALYDTSSEPHVPAWYQDEEDVPNADLNQIGIHVPFWHDAVKIPLPKEVRVDKMQYIEQSQLLVSPTTLPFPGEKVFVVGFPYGFSALGSRQPTPVTLTRFIAATRVEDRRTDMLLESIGAPGMSGGPVFAIRKESVYLLGMYTGLIFPDYRIGKNERDTALGTCVNMMLCWEELALVPYERGD